VSEQELAAAAAAVDDMGEMYRRGVEAGRAAYAAELREAGKVVVDLTQITALNAELGVLLVGGDVDPADISMHHRWTADILDEAREDGRV
jgi:glycine cleavage system aminomethyltransferase T